MIIDKIENAHLYAGLTDNICKALEILKDGKFDQKETGRHDVDGDNLYYSIQQYTTKPIEECKLEAHEHYIDVQFVASGEELLGYTLLDNPELPKPCSQKDGNTLYEVPANISRINFASGMFSILFPEDAHMPGCQLNGFCDVLKVVVKVKIND